MKVQDRIIVALDVSDLDKAKSLVETLVPHVGYFKVGLELLTAVGAPRAVEFIHSLGGQVFFDGKFCDIPNTVASASKAAAGLGVKMFDVHANCGIEAMRAAVQNKGNSFVLAVTVLTSLDEDNCHLIFGDPAKAKAMQFAREAKLAGVGGIICSPKELEVLAKQNELSGLIYVTPGVRPEWAAANDQKRVMTPAEAIRAGADMLVIGRPITNPPEAFTQVEAAKKIATEIAIGLKERFHATMFELKKIKFGAFKLKLHETNPEAPLSPIYLDIRNLPEWMYKLAGDLLHDLIVKEEITDFDYITGIPKAGEPIGKALANTLGKPFLRMKKVEQDGTRKISAEILDPFEKGKKVLIVDDLVTKAHTKVEAIEAIEANGLQVAATVVLYDREQGGLRELNEHGRKVCAVAKLSDILYFFVDEGKITAEKMSEVLKYTATN